MKAKSFFFILFALLVSLFAGCTVAPAHRDYGRHDRDYGRYERRYDHSEQLSIGAVRGAVPAAEALRSEVLNSVPAGGVRQSGTWNNRVRSGANTNGGSYGGEYADFELSGQSGGILK